jgi:hypothetical protein
MAKSKNTLDAVLANAGSFVTSRRGVWEHSDWESFVADAARAGVPDSDEGRLNLGNLLESLKYFYALEPAPAAKRSKKVAAAVSTKQAPMAKEKTKVKRKSKRKAKSKSK